MKTSQPPRGREAVREALIAAGARLFAEHGHAAVSVREVAREAGVNHGLVHRHFGSKEGLVLAVMSRLADGVANRMGPTTTTESLRDLLLRAFGATEEGQHWRILARAMLDGEPVADLQGEFPVVRRMVAAARRQSSDSLSAEALVSFLLSLGLGLVLFEPYLRAATAQDQEQWAETRRELGALALRLSEARSTNPSGSDLI